MKIVPENYLYAKVAKFIKNRKDLTDDSLAGLEEIVMDSAKAQAILDASKSSMGMDISVVDLLNIEMFAGRVIALADYRKQLSTYLGNKMNDVAPNLSSLIGDQVGARLIAHAGSLTNLAKYPASTVQILGAEKALFRALKTRGNTPKYGLLFHSTFIGRAGTKNKGRISRYLANKCSIASRIDCFTEVPTRVFGERLKQQVEERLKFYETGDIPMKNIDVMKEAIEENDVAIKQAMKSEKKKKKKKSISEDADESMNGTSTSTAPTTPVSEKKKKRKKSENSDEPDTTNGSTSAKKKKKLSQSENDDLNGGDGDDVAEAEGSPKKKKKKNKNKA